MPELSAQLVDETSEARRIQELESELGQMHEQLRQLRGLGQQLMMDSTLVDSVAATSVHATSVGVAEVITPQVVKSQLEANEAEEVGGNPEESKTTSNGTRTRRCLLIGLILGSLVILGTILASLFAAEKIGKGSDGTELTWEETQSSQSSAPTQNPAPTPSATHWKQLGQTLYGEFLEQMGGAVALSADGTTMAVGGSFDDAGGYRSSYVFVYSFDRATSRWSQLGQRLEGEQTDDSFGSAVALSADGDILAVGAFLNDGNGIYSGHVRIFEYDISSSYWNQLGQDLDGENATNAFGSSVALSADGDIVAAGGYWNSGNGDQSGHVRAYAFNRTQNRWKQLGEDLDGEQAGDWFGISVALSADGTILAAGAERNSGNGGASGHARLYEYDSATSQWNQLGQDLDGEAPGDYFGRSVDLSSDGTIVAVSAILNDGSGNDSGHARVFLLDRSSNLWNQIGQDLDGEGAGDSSGRSVAISTDGSIVAMGAEQNHGSGERSGSVRLYQYNSGRNRWYQLGQDLDGTAAYDMFGFAVALSSEGTIVAAGGIWNDEHGYNAGHVRVFERDD